MLRALCRVSSGLTACAAPGEDFPLANESLGRKACRALYYSAMGVSVRAARKLAANGTLTRRMGAQTVDNFHPKTNEVRRNCRVLLPSARRSFRARRGACMFP